ncbi:catalase HPII [Rhodococcus sp. 05-2256-B2]|uniref:catalase n=1 Tax=unclassified Rhodococcus (in: high G+C Gram-positive bacteria) TaxID=192944 RepID=UPI000B9B57C6|nr:MULTISPECIES: catalase [unclassified Rhodococcus (in: high G+C Gram-positive bacteria)]OZD78661.1 catalase HPII [Rhodococcus sp. 05-2256-B4]OZD93762.1 catalase HPII [Rhodococcus sp. 05-2256-B3]OZE00861.1 catalase HPII [Rhodococcus sp. 05-2256-B2]OZE04465.1 catalase HPII [Rhodococcus sp. 05-2256-B1]
MPPIPRPDQSSPAPNGPTGARDTRAQTGDFLTTAQGVRLPDTDHSLKAGDRGPTLLEDFHLREKITHFDHERIPERVVHARGAAAHGTFESYGSAKTVTKAGFLAQKGKRTPVFVRFSTVLGSRGSADTVRDTRGFAVKFYTDEGTFDLVGNNMPVFFIQDGIKFPDIIHAGKPQPDIELPQAQSAHDSFWDFVSLHTEATHHVMWNMSDRGIPRSYRTMEGFGVHTFRLVAENGETRLVKFHWKPLAGVHSLVWEEAQIAAGVDPDFHRRDMSDGIKAGAPLEYEFGIQVMPDDGTETYEGIDLLDPTKIVPEELVPVQPIGKLTLDANPTNYFAETEQVAFHTGHLVPGIEVTNDPLMQARLFSYLDTQITRLGGPNFSQLPINRPHAPVNDMLRDGMHQTAVHTGLAPYLGNSVDDGEPAVAGEKDRGYVQTERLIEGRAVRANPASFDDHFTQPTMFYRSLSAVEQDHLVEAFTFELGKVFEQSIKERELEVLSNVDADLCERVAAGLGLPAPVGTPAEDVLLSPALSQIVEAPGPIAGRKIGVIADAGSDLSGIGKLRTAAARRGATVHVIAAAGGILGKGMRTQVVERTFLTVRSIEFDAFVVAGGTTPTNDIKLILLLQEAFRHCKAMGAWGDGATLLEQAGIGADDAGVVIGETAVKAFNDALFAAVGLHRAWDRAPAVMASNIPPAVPDKPARKRAAKAKAKK